MTTDHASAPAAPVGVIHGRFQPLHLGHLEYLLAGAACCDVLVVGITSPDPWQRGDEPSAPARSASEANPWTFYERYLMVEASLVDAGVGRERFRIVPFPHSYPERLAHYAPSDALYLLSIYDEWGETKLRRLADLGLRTHVLWRRQWRLTSGSEVRHSIRDRDGRWRDLVPGPVARVIDEAGVAGRPGLGCDTTTAASSR
jgi:nicotinamide-nucleotide adenylyltransferase/phosphinothricin biosynthesis protein PhpF